MICDALDGRGGAVVQSGRTAKLGSDIVADISSVPHGIQSVVGELGVIAAKHVHAVAQGVQVQIYAGKGADQGIDADYMGAYGGVSGRWVFQYKFIHPSTDPTQARARLKKMFAPSAKGKRTSEFAKPGLQGLCGYVLLTNAPVTVSLVQSLREAFTVLYPEARFCAWDSASLNAMLRAHPHLARSRSQEMERLSLQQVIAPLWEWVEEAANVVHSWDAKENTVWPLQFTHRRQIEPKDDISHPYEPVYIPKLEWCSSPPWRGDDLVFDYASTTAFPQALTGVKRLQRAFSKLVVAVAHPIHALARDLRDVHGPLHEFMQEERERMALGMAIYGIETSWGYCPYLLVIQDNRILVEQRYIFEGSGGLRAREPMQMLITELRERYQHGENLPPSVVRAREQFAEALFSLADRLWYPATIGMDAPRDAADEEEP